MKGAEGAPLDRRPVGSFAKIAQNLVGDPPQLAGMAAFFDPQRRL
jgi:hypothetical protein